VSTRPLASLRIGLFGKGGSGKSTLAVFLSEALRGLGYPVLMLDADSTNLGLAEALGADRVPAPMLEHFGGMVFAGGRVTCPVDDPTPLAGAEVDLGALDERYVARNATGTTLLIAGKIGALGPGAGCDGPVAKIARDLRVSGLPGHVTLVDFKAGFEDTARGVLTSLDRALVAVDPTSAALQMAGDFLATFEQMRQGALPATRHLDRAELVEIALRLYRGSRLRSVSAVLSRIGDDAQERYLRARLGALQVPVLGSMPEDHRVQEQWLHGGRLRSPRLASAATALARRLEELAASRPQPEPSATAPQAERGAPVGALR